MTFTGIDIVFLIIVALLSIRAAIRGFVKELLGTAALLLGIAVAVLFSGLVAGMIEQYMGPTIWSQVIAFLGLFLVVYVVVKIFESALNRLIERIHLDQLDHALGFFLGIAEGLFIVFMLLLLIQIQPFFEPETLMAGSFFAHVMIPFLPFAAEFLRTGRLNV
ncbi:MAG: CvpA family protein [Spirochaetaceae bacterium]|nr:MAG: CvpA family protein [Spirochaetaceae bacterium]